MGMGKEQEIRKVGRMEASRLSGSDFHWGQRWVDLTVLQMVHQMAHHWVVSYPLEARMVRALGIGILLDS